MGQLREGGSQVLVLVAVPHLRRCAAESIQLGRLPSCYHSKVWLIAMLVPTQKHGMSHGRSLMPDTNTRHAELSLHRQCFLK